MTEHSKRIAIFSTSDIQQYVGADTYLKARPGNLRKAVEDDTFLMSTGNLERAVRLGFDIFVVTTRPKFSSTDDWWKVYVSEDQILTPDTRQDAMFANSPGLIAPWIRLFEKLGIPLPAKSRDIDDEEFLKDTFEGPLPQIHGFHTWLEARAYLLDAKSPHSDDMTIVSGSDFEHRRIFYVTGECQHIYGPRIIIQDSATSDVMDGLKKLCLWGGHDRTRETKNGTRRFFSFEFPTNGDSSSENFLKALAFLETHGYVCAKSSMMPELVEPR